MKTLRLLGLALAGISSSWVSSARGAVINFPDFGWQATVPDGVDLTALSVTNNGVTLALEKSADFVDQANTDGTITPLSITFHQTSSGAVPNLAISDEVVANDTGSDWDGFMFSLSEGTAVGGALPHFDSVRSPNFLTDPFVTRVMSADSRELMVTDGVVPSGGFPANLFEPGRLIAGSDVLDIVAEPLAAGDGQTFVFSEQPLSSVVTPFVPEPSSAGVVVMSLSLGGMVRPRRVGTDVR